MWFLPIVFVVCCYGKDYGKDSVKSGDWPWSDSVDWNTYFKYSRYMDKSKKFKLYWNTKTVDPNNSDDDIIEFGMEADSTGWIGIGISPNSKMPDSDIMLGWVDDNGHVHLYDMHTDKIRSDGPSIDSHNDLKLDYGEEIDGQTRIRFNRRKYLCDDNDEDLRIQLGTTRILYAFGDDPKDNNPSYIPQHTVFGSQSLNLDAGGQKLNLDDIDELIESDPDMMTSTIRMKSHVLLPEETNYYCTLVELPQLDTLHHIVKFEPMISEKSWEHVHHFNLYQCPNYKVNKSHIGHGDSCYTWGVAENYREKECIGLGVSDAIHVIYAWAVGMETSTLPTNVGVEMGGLQPDSLRYGILEMHYDNTKLKKDIIDDSGFKMWYTPNLREVSAGIMTMGHYYDERHFVPKGLTTINYGYCMADCTENGLPEDGVHVFGAFLHGHPIATALNVRQVRNGKELEPMIADWSYDFDYQQMIAIDNKLIMPGDDLILECYETNWRDRTTFGGIRTSTEMCLAFFWVYPKPKMKTCVTTFTQTEVEEWEKGAKSKGYLNKEATVTEVSDHCHSWNYLNQKKCVPFNYDITMDGAVQYYNQLWNARKYSKRENMCFDNVGDVVWGDNKKHFDDIPEYRVQFEPYTIKQNKICSNKDYEDYASEYINFAYNHIPHQGSVNHINVIIGAAVAGIILIISLAIYCYNKKNSETSTITNIKAKYSKVSINESNENDEDETLLEAELQNEVFQ